MSKTLNIKIGVIESILLTVNTNTCTHVDKKKVYLTRLYKP